MQPLTPSELAELSAIIGSPRYRITAKRPASYVDGCKRYYARAYVEHLLTETRDVSHVVSSARRAVERRPLVFRRKP